MEDFVGKNMDKPETYFEINELVSRLLELNKQRKFSFANAISTILNTPTIKIVHCKNCEYCVEWDNYNPHEHICMMWDGDCGTLVDPNGYCHYGKIK